MKKIFITLLLVSSLCACSKEDSSNDKNECPDISISVRDFEVADDAFTDLTRSSISLDPTTGKFSFQWKNGDVLGVFPHANDLGQQMLFKTKLAATEIGRTDFEGSTIGWFLSPGIKYASYYPYINDCELRSDGIEFSYAGQTQSGNNLTESMTHLGAYDFLNSDIMTATDGGKMSFHFSHCGAIVLFRQKLADAASYSKMTLTVSGASEPLFPSKIKLDLFGSTVISPTDLKYSFEVTLENFSVSAGGFMNVWCMMPPVDLSGKKITVTMKNADPAEADLSFDLDGKNFQSAYAYNLGSSTEISTDTYPELIVDLGLPSGTRWAKYNLGAQKEGEAGFYYEWGGTVEKTSGFSTWTGGTVLDDAHDAAHLKLGGNWAIPTIAQFEELKNNCTLQAMGTSTTSSPPLYIVFTSNINKEKITFFSAGYYNSYYGFNLTKCSDGKYTGGYGFYWTKNEKKNMYWVQNSSTGPSLTTYSTSYILLDVFGNCYGAPIRPVNNANTDWSKLK